MKAWQFLLFTGAILGTALFVTGCFDDSDENAEESSSEPEEIAPPPEPPPAAQVFVFANGSKIQFGDSENSEIPKGGFSNFVGKLEVAGGELVPDGKHSVTIDMNSVFTSNHEFTEALKSDDFFAISFFSSARLSVNKATPVGEGVVELSGNFDFHGASKAISFPATVTSNSAGDRLDLKADIPIKWSDFGIVPAPGSEKLIWEEAVIHLEVVASPGELQNLVLTPIGGEPVVTRFEGTQSSSPQQRGGGLGGRGGGKSREDWRNMSEEERAERRRQFIAEMDTNKDGNLGKDEIPERMWEFMGAADKNGDDMITEAERTAFRAEREAERAMRELNGEEPLRPGPGKGGPRGPSGGGDRD